MVSGLEIPALVAGFWGAGAGSVSAYKDMKKGREMRRSSQTKTYYENGRPVIEKQSVATYGRAECGKDANGNLYARSWAGGAAGASYSVDRRY